MHPTLPAKNSFKYFCAPGVKKIIKRSLCGLPVKSLLIFFEKAFYFRILPQTFANMNHVLDILSRKGSNAISVSPDTTVLTALKVMADNNIGSVLVMENEEYLGLVTERDYSRKVILKGKNSTDTKVSEIMSSDLPHVNPDDTIEHCMELMTDGKIRYLPVFKNNKLQGIISITDVVRETILKQQQTISHLDSYINS
jgi:CBS domain-containing protein